MSHFGDSTYLQNIFHTHRWICLVRALFQAPIWLFFEWWFVDQKWPNWPIRLHILIFWFDEYSESQHFLSFLSFSNGTLKLAPLKVLEKLFQSRSLIYQKIVRKDVFSFSRKCEKQSKLWCLWGCCNRG